MVIVEVPFYQVDIEYTAPLVEKKPFSSLNMLALLSKMTIYTGLFLDSLLYSMIYVSVLIPRPHATDYPSFLVSLDWAVSVFQFCIFQNYFGYSRPLALPYKLQYHLANFY